MLMTHKKLYGFCRSDHTANLCQQIMACVEDVHVAEWMSANCLQLNVAKTEFLWCSSCQRLHQLPVSPVVFSGNAVLPHQWCMTSEYGLTAV